ncbi:hypothetical protein ACWEWX_24725 [Streptomyces asiaticus]
MQRIIAVEEQIATDAFLDTAHRLDVVPGERTAIGLMRIVERPGPVRAALTHRCEDRGDGRRRTGDGDPVRSGGSTRQACRTNPHARSGDDAGWTRLDGRRWPQSLISVPDAVGLGRREPGPGDREAVQADEDTVRALAGDGP